MSDNTSIKIIEAGLIGGAVEKKTENVPCSCTQVQFNLLSDTISTVATYQVAHESGNILASGSVTLAEDGKGAYTMDVDNEFRNSKVVVSFSINDSFAGEYTLNIDPAQLDIESVLFADPEFAGQNRMRVNGGTKVSITVRLKRKVVTGESVRLQYKAYKKDPGGSVYKEYVHESVSVAAGRDVVEMTVEPQESHSGTTIAVSFFLRDAIEPEEGTNQGTVRYLDVVSERGTGITHMYWSSVERIDWEASPTPSRRTEICNNEIAFLHIRTRQLYGQTVMVYLHERDITGVFSSQYLDIQSHAVVIQDNVACLSINMRDVCRALRGKRSFENGDYELFCTIAYPVHGTFFFHKMPDVEDLLLRYNRASSTPATSTLEGTKKFVIGTEEDEQSRTNDGKKRANEKELYINVILPQDRACEGLMVIFDETQRKHICYALGRGSNRNRIRAGGNGDTPTGLCSTNYERAHIGEASYGHEGVIRLEGKEGEFLIATQNGRAGILIHAGHTIGDKGQTISDNGALMSTYGCIRVYNSDMKQIVSIYNEYKAKNYTIYCYIEDVSNLDSVFTKYNTVKDPKDNRRTINSNTQ